MFALVTTSHLCIDQGIRQLLNSPVLEIQLLLHVTLCDFLEIMVLISQTVTVSHKGILLNVWHFHRTKHKNNM